MIISGFDIETSIDSTSNRRSISHWANSRSTSFDVRVYSLRYIVFNCVVMIITATFEISLFVTSLTFGHGMMILKGIDTEFINDILYNVN